MDSVGMKRCSLYDYSEQAMAARLSISRIQSGITQKSMAKELGASLRAYHHYEKGQRGLPSRAIGILNDSYDIDANWLTTGVYKPISPDELLLLNMYTEQFDAYMKTDNRVLYPVAKRAIWSYWMMRHQMNDPLDENDVHTLIELFAGVKFKDKAA